jgi:hypothetical protein
MEVAQGIDSGTLQVMHFKNRDRGSTTDLFPQGKRGKVQVIDETFRRCRRSNWRVGNVDKFIARFVGYSGERQVPAVAR